MKKIVFDSYALISFFRKEPAYETVRDLLVKIANNESEAYMCSVNVGEIYYMPVRKGNIKNPSFAITEGRVFLVLLLFWDF